MEMKSRASTFVWKRLVYRSVASLAYLLVLLCPAGAERLPVKSYTTADGLPVDIVIRIRRDSRGFLWFCTRDGLSKFDGYRFTNYGKERGLPHPQVNDLIECSDGTYWVATNGGGVASFNPAARVPTNTASRFKVYSLGYDPASNVVNCLCEDRQGRIWVGTDKGLFYYDKTQDRFIAAIPDPIDIYSLCADGRGVLWIGVGNQLWRRNPEGQLTRYSFQVSRDPGRIFSLLEGSNGKLWAGSGLRDCSNWNPKQLPLQDSALPVRNGPLIHHTTADGAVIGTIQDLHKSPDGHLWIAAAPDYTTSLGGGLFKFDGQKFRRYGKEQGLTNDSVKCLEADNEGNLWLGSGGGAMKITGNGFTAFGEPDGLPRGPIAMIENRSGELCAISERGTLAHHFEDGRFISTRFNVPVALQNNQLWGNYQITFQDHEGDWWVPTLKGLMRFAGVARMKQLAHARPKALYTLEGGTQPFDIYRMFEDSRGDIWVGLGTVVQNRLLKWERSTERFQYYTEANGVPPRTRPPHFAKTKTATSGLAFITADCCATGPAASHYLEPKTACLQDL